MEKLKGLSKGGWHPEKDGGGLRNSLSSSLKGVKGMVGKADDSKETVYSETYVRKDPSLFPPPPKTRTYAEGETPDVRARSTVTSPIQKADETEAPTYRRGPFVANTLGVDNSQFPKPPPTLPGRSSPASPSTALPKGKPPSLPPRLPPRENETSQESQASATNGYLNQGALNRLGQAGISVPGLGIGSPKSPPVPPPGAVKPATNGASNNTQIDELQSRFSKLGSTTSTSPTAGTSWAEKKAALNTANNFRNNPSSVSVKDIRSAATTAKSFQDRHGDQVVAGMQSANQMNQKYGILDRVNNAQQPSSPIKKAPPPVPPAKKPSLMAQAPPVPMSSKPRG